MRYLKLAFASVLVVLTLGTAVQPAAAYDISFGAPADFTASGQVTFTDSQAGTPRRCQLTLSGTYGAGPIPAASGWQLGPAGSAAFSLCQVGAFTVLSAGAPWPMTIDSFLGTLPNAATGMRVNLPGFGFEQRTNVGGGVIVTCLYVGTLAYLVQFSGANPYALGSISLLGSTLPLVSGSPLCPSSGRLTGTLTASTAPTMTIR